MNHTVKISINANGRLSYSHRVLHVEPGETVRWFCKKPYAIQFADNKDPFTPSTRFLVKRGNAYTRKCQVKRPTRALKPAKKHWPFKYAVAVFVGGAHPVLTDDPHIIIDY